MTLNSKLEAVGMKLELVLASDPISFSVFERGVPP
jgi:hypothetical protein